MDDVISLGVGEPDFTTPWTIRESGIFSLEKGHTSYTSNLGTIALRREICDYVASDYHVRYSPENECIVTVGVSEALDIAIRALVNPGDEVIYTEPCFVSYPAEVRMAHGVPVAGGDLREGRFRARSGGAPHEDHAAQPGAAAELPLATPWRGDVARGAGEDRRNRHRKRVWW